EFGIILLARFYEELGNGVAVDEAARATLRGVGGPIVVSAITLAGGFAVLAISALFPGGLPLLGGFGLSVVIDLGLALAAVFWVMFPLAVLLERQRPSPPALFEEAAPVPETPTRAEKTANPLGWELPEEPKKPKRRTTRRKPRASSPEQD